MPKKPKSQLYRKAYELSFKLDENHSFCKNGIVLIPYQHHKNKLTWLVRVKDGVRLEHCIQIADTAIEAAMKAYEIYEEIISLEENWVSKKVRKELPFAV